MLRRGRVGKSGTYNVVFVSYIIYNLLLWVTLVLGSPVWLVLAIARKKWRSGIAERLGFVPGRLRPEESGKPVLWLHAVSVGEVLAAERLIRELQQDHQVFVSTTTLAAQTLARQRFGAGYTFYFPIDLSIAVKAYLRRLQPRMVVLLETEFWPNFLHASHRVAKVAVVNARISDRSLPGYTRRRSLMSSVLENVDLFLAQSHEDAQRLIRIGAQAQRVRVGGNLKFDWNPPEEPALVAALREAIHEQQRFPVIVAGSTVENEEPLLLKAFATLQERYPRSLLVLAPRHPERFDVVADVARAEGYSIARRSQHADVNGSSIYLLDSIGELASMYELADIAFVGGSLVPRGGHNILEPAYFGRAIVVGPYTENFRDVVNIFETRAALLRATHEELGNVWLKLTQDDAARKLMGERARGVMESSTGATQHTLDALEEIESSR